MCQELDETLAGKFTQELLLIHPILEGFPPIDKDNRHFVVKLTTKFMVSIDIDFAPGKTSAARELGETLLDHLAQVAAFPGIDDDVP